MFSCKGRNTEEPTCILKRPETMSLEEIRFHKRKNEIIELKAITLETPGSIRIICAWREIIIHKNISL